MKKIYVFLVILAVVAVAVAGFWAVREWMTAPEVENVRLVPAKVSEIRSMVELSTVELYEELPLKASIGKRHLVARVVMEGSVGFDLDRLKVTERGDTIVVKLPPERVTLRESTRPGSYTVIDTWSDDPFGSAQFTTAEENALKRRFTESAVRGVYRRGDVRRARQSAAESVRTLLSGATGRPVVVE